MSTVTEVDLDEVLKAAVEAAQTAGRIIKKALDERDSCGPAITVKGGVDLVTETDQLCETTILNKLKTQFPTHSFVGEESTFAEGPEGSAGGQGSPAPSGPAWFIDPLDGTTNFVHGYPFLCVSIGFTIDGVPTAGVVFNPVMDELYTAAKGKGAFLNGRPIHVSGAKHVGEAMVVNNIGASRDMAFVDKTLGRVRGLLAQNLRAIRNSGSAAVNMAHVACGVVDVYYEDGYGGPWDVAAGAILVQEAGGVVRTPEGEPFVLRMGKGRVMCGPADVCADVSRILNATDAARATEEAVAVSPSVLHLSVGVVIGLAVGVMLMGVKGKK